MTKKIGRQMNRPCPDCGKFLLRMIINTEDRGGKDFETKEIICSKCGYSEPYHLSLSHRGKELPSESSW
jgi:predicted nucleic-acid-binding Zn-ribbon protein